MSQLVCQHLHVKDCLIKIGEHKRCPIIREKCHISRSSFSRLILQIHQFVLNHKINELSSLRADLMVHLPCLFHHKIIISRRNGISIRKYTLLIIKHQCIHTNPLRLRRIELFTQRYEFRTHLLAERCHLFFPIIRASLLHVPHRNKVGIAEVLPHLIADGNEFLPDLLQPLLIAVVKIRICPHSRTPYFSVLMFKILLYPIEIKRLPFKFDRRRCHDLLIFVCQLRLLLHQRNICLTEGLPVQFLLCKILFPVLFLDVIAKRTIHHCRIKCKKLRHHGRYGIVDIFVFLLIISIRRI